MTHIGESIRRLRKQAGMTQEALAGAMNVSYQAVSKWENGAAMPDITLVPMLAKFFRVTTDEILGYDPAQTEEAVMALCREAAAFRAADPLKSRAMLEEALKKYLGDEIILNNILCTMDVDREPDAVIAAAMQLIDCVRLPDVHCDALRFLADAYKAKGDFVSARAALERLPAINFTWREELVGVIRGEERIRLAKEQKALDLQTLLTMMAVLAEEYAVSGAQEKAKAEVRRALKVLSALEGDEAAGLLGEEKERLEILLK